MREIIGCKAEGNFVYCVDCRFQDSNTGCMEYIALYNAELQISTDCKKQVQVAGVGM